MLQIVFLPQDSFSGNHWIDRDQLAEAWAVWTLKMDEPMPHLLARRGLITAEVRREVDRRLECKLTEHRGDPAKSSVPLPMPRPAAEFDWSTTRRSARPSAPCL